MVQLSNFWFFNLNDIYMQKEYIRYIKRNEMKGGNKKVDQRFLLSVRDPWLYYIQIG